MKLNSEIVELEQSLGKIVLKLTKGCFKTEVPHNECG